MRRRRRGGHGAGRPPARSALHVHTEWAAVRAHRLRRTTRSCSAASCAPDGLRSCRPAGAVAADASLAARALAASASAPACRWRTSARAEATWELWAGKRRRDAGRWRRPPGRGGTTGARSRWSARWTAARRSASARRAPPSARPRGPTTARCTLAGEMRAAGAHELVLSGRARLEQHAFTLEPAGAGESAPCSRPGAIPRWRGERPLRADAGSCGCARAAGDAGIDRRAAVRPAAVARGDRAQAVPVRDEPGGRRDPARGARPRRRRARPPPAAPPARHRLHRPPHASRCATRSCLSASTAASISDNPRAHLRGARPPRRAARARVGGARRALPRAGHGCA